MQRLHAGRLHRTECRLLGVDKIRGFVTAICFGCMFLWILCGCYLEGDQSYPLTLSASSSNGLPQPAQRRTNPFSLLQKAHTEMPSVFRRRLLLEASSSQRRALQFQLDSGSGDDADGDLGSGSGSGDAKEVSINNAGFCTSAA